MRRCRRFHAVALAGLVLAGCGGLVPRAGHPWIEDLSLTLEREVLVLEVLEERVSVDARFRFEVHGKARDRVMFFPVAPPGGRAAGFEALLGGPDDEPLALPVRPALPGALPAGQALQTFDILVPGEALERHGGQLVVRYEQEATCGFAYILGSGAYWRGPIGELVVRLVDRGSRVASASVEGQAPHLWKDGTATWSWKGLEPRSGVVLVLSCP